MIRGTSRPLPPAHLSTGRAMGASMEGVDWARGTKFGRSAAPERKSRALLNATPTRARLLLFWHGQPQSFNHLLQTKARNPQCFCSAALVSRGLLQRVFDELRLERIDALPEVERTGRARRCVWPRGALGGYRCQQ